MVQHEIILGESSRTFDVVWRALQFSKLYVPLKSGASLEIIYLYGRRCDTMTIQLVSVRSMVEIASCLPKLSKASHMKGDDRFTNYPKQQTTNINQLIAGWSQDSKKQINSNITCIYDNIIQYMHYRIIYIYIYSIPSNHKRCELYLWAASFTIRRPWNTMVATFTFTFQNGRFGWCTWVENGKKQRSITSTIHM